MKFIIASAVALFMLTGCFEEGSTEANATNSVKEVITGAFTDKVDEVADTVKTEVMENVEAFGPKTEAETAPTDAEVAEAIEVIAEAVEAEAPNTDR